MTQNATVAAGTPSFMIPEHVLYRPVGGQMVLLDLDSEQYYGLNEVGADIISRLTEHPFEAAITSLARNYEVDAEVLRQDVDELVRELLEAGLLDHAGSSN